VLSFHNIRALRIRAAATRPRNANSLSDLSASQTARSRPLRSLLRGSHNRCFNSSCLPVYDGFVKRNIAEFPLSCRSLPRARNRLLRATAIDCRLSSSSFRKNSSDFRRLDVFTGYLSIYLFTIDDCPRLSISSAKL